MNESQPQGPRHFDRESKSNPRRRRPGGDDITPRQGEILKMVVSGYIQEAQPISSFYITDNFDIGLSSATIRAVFAILEDMGYLYSPHRSSGRVPTPRAYRYFVEHLPPPGVILEDDQRRIQSEYLKHEFRLPEILDVTSKLLSVLTNYAAVVLGPEPEKAVLKHLELIDMGADEVLVILVTRSGAVYSRTIFVENRIPADTLRHISRRLNEQYKGMDLAEIRRSLAEARLEAEGISLDFGGSREANQLYFPMIARTIVENFDQVQGEEQIFTAGIDNLYSQMTLAGAESNRIKELGVLFDSTDFLRGMFKKAISLDEIEVFIQDGVEDERLGGLSIVQASYKMGETRIGSLGVVGPNRMDYVRVMNVVEYMRRVISNMVTRISN